MKFWQPGSVLQLVLVSFFVALADPELAQLFVKERETLSQKLRTL
jgi:hypothetical protein